MEGDLTPLWFVSGSYHGELTGFKCDVSPSGVSVSPMFEVSDNDGSVRSVCLAGSGEVLSGGQDMMVRVYDVARLRNTGMLDMHTSPVSCISAHGRHVVTSNQSGEIAVLRAGDWELLGKAKHSSQEQPVIGLHLHPSGVLMLSLSPKSLAIWDMRSLRRLVSVPLALRPSQSSLSESGSLLCIAYDRWLAIHPIGTDDIGAIAQFQLPVGRQVASMGWITLSADGEGDAPGEETEILVVGTNDGRLIALQPMAVNVARSVSKRPEFLPRPGTKASDDCPSVYGLTECYNQFLSAIERSSDKEIEEATESRRIKSICPVSLGAAEGVLVGCVCSDGQVSFVRLYAAGSADVESETEVEAEGEGEEKGEGEGEADVAMAEGEEEGETVPHVALTLDGYVDKDIFLRGRPVSALLCHQPSPDAKKAILDEANVRLNVRREKREEREKRIEAKKEAERVQAEEEAKEHARKVKRAKRNKTRANARKSRERGEPVRATPSESAAVIAAKGPIRLIAKRADPAAEEKKVKKAYKGRGTRAKNKPGAKKEQKVPEKSTRAQRRREAGAGKVFPERAKKKKGADQE
ncbi:hypothetical protein KIPB_004764 [Kipferlia bialata]|uniref:Uncharacterized protein n=1 Tax=Kipferlia bialata TaxID=797122 RepID=A0A9K3GHP3_9EUKA|nr:hypothetical protein KIPB_004764 [Kipferlia bialata]|eukprot:g4764.t1